MKSKMFSFWVSLFVMFTAVFSFVACGGNATASVVEKTDTLIVIRVDDADEGVVLFNVMKDLQKQNQLQFELSGTMLSSLNGKHNLADFSACWMLYTSDTAMGNAQWGTYDYQGMVCLSAILGGDALTVSSGNYYVWVYVTF